MSLRCLLALVALRLAFATAARRPRRTRVGVDMSCVAPAGDPAPNTPEWIQRDTLNQYCAGAAHPRPAGQPRFRLGNLHPGRRALRRAGDRAGWATPARAHGGVTTLIPGSQAADPFRTIKRWTEAPAAAASRRSSSRRSNGATLRGHVFMPPASVPRPKGGYPGVVITDGSVQAYEELYFWAAEDLAEAGYMVMTYDVQGQGDSDLLPAGLPGPDDCSGVPYQQNYNFFQGAEDSLSFFLSRRATRTPTRPRPRPRRHRRPLARRRGGQRGRPVRQPRQGDRRLGQPARDRPTATA